jgi:hypothetical protein
MFLSIVERPEDLVELLGQIEPSLKDAGREFCSQDNS